MLQFSRGERGTLRVTRERVDIAALVAETVETFRPIAAARGVTIATTLARDAMAEVDRDAVRQIVLNLLDNAVKYGPAGQEVRVSVSRERRVASSSTTQGPAFRRASGSASGAASSGWSATATAPSPARASGWRSCASSCGCTAARVRVEESARGGATFIVELPA